MIKQSDTCPFCKDDWIIYSPSSKGTDADVMSSVPEKLVSGKAYKVAEVQQESYILVEGYQHSGGGIYDTEFKLIDSNSYTSCRL